MKKAVNALRAELILNHNYDEFMSMINATRKCSKQYQVETIADRLKMESMPPS